MSNKTALVFDDAPDHLFIIKRLFEVFGFKVFCVNPKEDPNHWEDLIPEEPTSIVITDFNMGLITGPAVIGVLKQQWKMGCPSIICWSAWDLTPQQANLAMSAGAAATCKKILNRDTVREIVRRYVE